ncbi:MAG: hypothetical protein ACRCUS_00395 [Anaerovoracaceae bacterium]
MYKKLVSLALILLGLFLCSVAIIFGKHSTLTLPGSPLATSLLAVGVILLAIGVRNIFTKTVIRGQINKVEFSYKKNKDRAEKVEISRKTIEILDRMFPRKVKIGTISEDMQDYEIIICIYSDKHKAILYRDKEDNSLFRVGENECYFRLKKSEANKFEELLKNELEKSKGK